jgi:hypothetical protein
MLGTQARPGLALQLVAASGDQIPNHIRSGLAMGGAGVGAMVQEHGNDAGAHGTTAIFLKKNYLASFLKKYFSKKNLMKKKNSALVSVIGN